MTDVHEIEVRKERADEIGGPQGKEKLLEKGVTV